MVKLNENVILRKNFTRSKHFSQYFFNIKKQTCLELARIII